MVDGGRGGCVNELLVVQYKFGGVCINGDTRWYGIVVAVVQRCSTAECIIIIIMHAREGTAYSTVTAR